MVRLHLGLKTTLTRQNVGELEEMRQMAHNWGLPFSAGWLLSKRRHRAPSGVNECRLHPSKCAALEPTKVASTVELSETASRESIIDNNNDNIYCQAGKSAFIVSPIGKMNLCLDLPMPAVDILDAGFPAAWTQLRSFIEAAPPYIRHLYRL
ncbi:MAG: hypothetical protein ACLPX5_16315 [Dissulfurispiraceae bacterium]